MFPNCRERPEKPGHQAFRRQQQMLAIGRILRTGARLLRLDEPRGLAPVIVCSRSGEPALDLKREGFTILLASKRNFRFAQTVADRYYVVEQAR